MTFHARLTRVDVLGIHQQFIDLLVVEIGLSEVPPSRWARLFHRAADVTLTNAQGDLAEATFAPLLDGDTVLLTPRDKDLDAEVARVVALIHETNERYALEQTGEYLPDEPSSGEPVPLADHSYREAARLLSARKRLESLSDIYTADDGEPRP